MVSSSGDPRPILCGLAAAITATAILAACTLTPSASVESAFVGDWVTAENASITISPDTIIQHQPDGESTRLDKSTCRGKFSFAYATKSRQALTDLVPRQPELRRKLSDVLVEPSYRVAELDCDRGDQTYVMLDERQLVAIYRDGDIGAIERLARR